MIRLFVCLQAVANYMGQAGTLAAIREKLLVHVASTKGLWLRTASWHLDQELQRSR